MKFAKTPFKLRWLVLFLVLVGVNYALLTWKPWRSNESSNSSASSSKKELATSFEAQFIGQVMLPSAYLEDPYGIVTAPDGSVFIADAGEQNRILKISASGDVQVLLGGREGFENSELAQNPSDPNAKIINKGSLHTPSGLALDHAGNLYIADTGNHAIRKLSKDGQLSTLAGTGQAGQRDGLAAQAQFNGPTGVAVDERGNVYVSDTYNDQIRKIDTQGRVTTLAGTGQHGWQDGVATQAQFDTPTGIAVTAQGVVWVADTRNHALRKIEHGSVTTFMKTNPEDKEAWLRKPIGLSLTHDGHLYISENQAGRILHIAPDGRMRGITGIDVNFKAGDASALRLQTPVALSLSADGSLWAVDGRARQVSRFYASSNGTGTTPQLNLAQLPQIQKPALPAVGQFPWPLAPQQQTHEVVGTMGEVRGDYQGESRHHFHAGLDIQGALGETVKIVAPEKVSAVLNTFGAESINEGVRLDEFAYIHMKVGRTAQGHNLNPSKFIWLTDAQGKLDYVRIRRGTRFAVGEDLGTLNRMYHVHLNYSPAGNMRNALSLGFIGFSDTVAPRLLSVQLTDEQGNTLVAKKIPAKLKASTTVSTIQIPAQLDKLRLLVEAYDQNQGNVARRRLGLYKVGYQWLSQDGQLLPGHEQPTWSMVFDQLPPDDESVKVAYAKESGITVHGSAETRFVYEVNNHVSQGQAQVGYLQRADLLKASSQTTPANQGFILRVMVQDFSGNTSHKDLQLEF